MQKPARIALATAAEVAHLDEDGQHLITELGSSGALAEPAIWDDLDVDWAAYDLVVVHSTWDYATQRERFLGWAEEVSGVSTLANTSAVLRWNTDKRYLDDLAADGIPIVPTIFVTAQDSPDHALLDVEHVVKPTVSAGSKDTLRLRPQDRRRSVDLVRTITGGGRTAMVQPYLSGVDTVGETSLLFIDGEYSHAIRKGAILEPGADLVAGLFAEEDISAREPSAAQMALALQVMAAIPGDRPPLYARVDLLPSDEGPLVLELELTEPSMFLGTAPGSVGALAAAILRWATH